MGTERNADDQRGLGRVVYSKEPTEAREERRDTTGPTDVIEEASEDSFPASDPPAYATGRAEDVSVEPGAQAEIEAVPHTEAVQAQSKLDRRNDPP